jgi:hypothetical protein
MDDEADAAVDYEKLVDDALAFVRGREKDEIFLRVAGNYFRPLEDLWTVGQVDGIDESHQLIDPAWYGGIVRSLDHGRALYPEIVLEANLNKPLVLGASRSSTTNTAKGKGKKLDMFFNRDPEAAHLISRAPLCHKAYGFLAQAATGKMLGPADNEDRLKLLNGVSEGNKRVPNTGLKHHKYNKMLLRSQQLVLDGDEPRIIIIPLLTVQEVREWNGRDTYEVMAIPCGSDAAQGASDLLKFVGRFCSPEEIEKGRILLEAFTRGIASSIKQHNVTESFAPIELQGQRLVAWLALVSEIKGNRDAGVSLPQALPARGLPAKPVAKAEMSLRFSLPDPFLVAVKAAVCYSKLCGRTLMPACPEPGSDASLDDDDDDESAGDHDASARDFSSIAASLVNPKRRQVELFSDDS